MRPIEFMKRICQHSCVEEIVVARSNLSAVLLSLTTVIAAGPFALLIAWRVSRMKLSVTQDSVIVVNFLKQYEIPLNEVEIHDNRDRSPLLSDAGGRLDTDGRVLSVSNGSSPRVPISIAPAFGSRLDTIAEDLYRAIDKMKASHPES